MGVRHFLIGFFIFFSGCSHQIAFQDIDYSIAAQRQDAKLTVEMDSYTLSKEVPIRSFMTGIANDWNAQPGKMVKQVADIEFPQMFKEYEFLEVSAESQQGNSPITMRLYVPNYDFSNFRATFTLNAKAYGENNKVLLNKTYTETGMSQGSKMFWGGAFGMKSSIRQSSFDALKKIFASLRQDLMKALSSNESG